MPKQSKKLPKHMAYATGITRAQYNGNRDFLNKVDMTNRVATERPMRINRKLAELREKEKEQT